jgi:phage shock protein C
MANSTTNRLRSGLHLDKKNGWIAGVCAGLANYLDTDPAIIRVGAIVTGLFLPKIVISVYLVAWLVLDEG